MSSPTPLNQPDQGSAIVQTQQQSDTVLELLEVRQDRGAKTFVYKEPERESRGDTLWGKIQKMFSRLN